MNAGQAPKDVVLNQIEHQTTASTSFGGAAPKR